MSFNLRFQSVFKRFLTIHKKSRIWKWKVCFWICKTVVARGHHASPWNVSVLFNLELLKTCRERTASLWKESSTKEGENVCHEQRVEREWVSWNREIMAIESRPFLRMVLHGSSSGNSSSTSYSSEEALCKSSKCVILVLLCYSYGYL